MKQNFKQKLLAGLLSACMIFQTVGIVPVYAVGNVMDSGIIANAITAFAPLAQSEYTLPVGADEATIANVLAFPKTIKATVNDTETELAVIWESDKALSTEKADTFTYTAKLTDEGYTLAEGISLPTIEVRVSENDIALMALNDVFKSGNCAENNGDIIWTLTQNNADDTNPTYTLTITGYGEIKSGNHWRSYASQITKLVFVETETGITKITTNNFINFTNLSGTLTLPEHLKSLGDSAFNGCSSLTGNLTLPESLESIGNDAFFRCSGFNGTLTLPANLKSIGGSAFSGCSGFTGTLTLPANLKSIGGSAFSGCSGFTGTLTLPANLKSIGAGAFGSCAGFTGTLTLPANLTSIGNDTFNECTGFTGTLALPANLLSIGEAAFQNCMFTGKLELPSKLTTIEVNAFNNCNKFTAIYIPASVTSIPRTSNMHTTFPYNKPIYSLADTSLPGLAPFVRDIKPNFTLKHSVKGVVSEALLTVYGDGAQTHTVTTGDLTITVPEGYALEGLYSTADYQSGTKVTAGDTLTFKGNIVLYANLVKKPVAGDITAVSIQKGKDVYEPGVTTRPVTLTMKKLDASGVAVEGQSITVTATATLNSANAGTYSAYTLSNLQFPANSYYDATGSISVSGDTYKITVVKSGTTFDGGIKAYNGNTETSNFAYGDTITVTAKPKATGIAARSLTAPTANQMALFVGSTQITAPVNVGANGVYTMTYDTKGKDLAIGSNIITAKYVGNANMAVYSDTVTVTLNKKAITSASVNAGATKVYDGTNSFTGVALTLNASGILSGDTVTATAGGTAADANVGATKDFKATSVTLAGAQAGYYTLAASAVSGNVAITAAIPTVTVTAEKKKVRFFSLGNHDDTIILKATVTGMTGGTVPTGTIAFKSEATTIASAVEVTNGVATYDWVNPNAANHTITAEFVATANTNYENATGTSTAFDIDKAEQKALNISGVPNKVTYGDSNFTLSTTGGSGTGTAVTYAVTAGSDVVSVVESTGVVTVLKAGTATITAAKAGDGNYNAKTGTVEITVQGAKPTVTWGGNATQTVTYTGSEAVITAPTATGVTGGTTPNGTISYTYEKKSFFSLFTTPENGLPVNAGTYTVTAHIAAEGNYTAADSTTMELTIEKSTPTLAIGAGYIGKTYDGTAVTNPTAENMTITGANYTDVKFAYSKNSNMGSSTNNAPKDAGTYYVQASVKAGDNTNAASSAAVSFTITQAALTVTGGTVTQREYNGGTGAAVTSLTFNGLVNDETLALTTDYTVDTSAYDTANAGTGKTVTGTAALVSNTKTDNYTLTEAYSITDQTISAKPLTEATITVGGDYTYTGAEIIPTAANVTVKDGATTLVKGADYDYVASDNINAGTAKITITGKGNYTDTAIKTFTITKADGTQVKDYAVPTARKAITNSSPKLSNVTLDGKGDGVWSWSADKDLTADNKNKVQTFKATFTPTDSKNYDTVEVDVKVSVSKLSIAIEGSKLRTLNKGAKETLTSHVTVVGAALKEGIDYNTKLTVSKENIVSVSDNEITANNVGTVKVTLDVMVGTIKAASDYIVAKVESKDDGEHSKNTADEIKDLTDDILKEENPPKEIVDAVADATIKMDVEKKAKLDDETVKKLDKLFKEANPDLEVKDPIIEKKDGIENGISGVDATGVALAAGLTSDKIKKGDTVQIKLEQEPPIEVPETRKAQMQVKLTLLVNGEKASLESPLVIDIQLDKNMKTDGLEIAHKHDDGTIDILTEGDTLSAKNFIINKETKVLTMRVTSFSTFTFTTTAEKPIDPTPSKPVDPTPSKPESGTSSTTSTASSTTSSTTSTKPSTPSTGDSSPLGAMAGVIILSLAGMVGLVWKKKNR